MRDSSLFYRVFINSSIQSLLIIYALLVSLLIAKSIATVTLQETLFGIIAGVLAWTLAEYFVHRFLFHGERKMKLLQKLQYFMHGYHHSRPRDPERLVLPFILTLPMSIGLYFGLSLLLKSYVSAVSAGVLLGYICYDVSHYVIHRLQPRTRFGKFRREYHYHHHFKEQTKCFGVTSPFWDYVFRTTRSDKN